MNRVAATVDAFLDDIAATPDDPTPRLIFADWLEELGQLLWPASLRGENTYAPNGEDRAVARLRNALGDGTRVYVGDVTLANADGVTLEMRHGVGAALRCNVETWWKCGPRLVRALPLTAVRFTGLVPHVCADALGYTLFWSTMLVRELNDGFTWERSTRGFGGPHWLPVDWSDDPSIFHGETFSTADAAIDAASRGALRWARAQNENAVVS